MAHRKKENFIAIRASLRLTLCTVASLFVSGRCLCAGDWHYNGSWAGKNVEPSTSTEKRYESDQQRREGGEGGAVGGGGAGVEAMPGTQGGAAAPRENKRYIAM